MMCVFRKTNKFTQDRAKPKLTPTPTQPKGEKMKLIRAKLILGLAIGTIVSLITAQYSRASFEAPISYEEEETSVPYMSPEEILMECQENTSRSNRNVTDYYESVSKDDKRYSPWSNFDCVNLAFSSPAKAQKIFSRQRAFINCIENEEVRLPPKQLARFCNRR